MKFLFILIFSLTTLPLFAQPTETLKVSANSKELSDLLYLGSKTIPPAKLNGISTLEFLKVLSSKQVIQTPVAVKHLETLRNLSYKSIVFNASGVLHFSEQNPDPYYGMTPEQKQKVIEKLHLANHPLTKIHNAQSSTGSYQQFSCTLNELTTYLNAMPLNYKLLAILPTSATVNMKNEGAWENHDSTSTGTSQPSSVLVVYQVIPIDTTNLKLE